MNVSFNKINKISIAQNSNSALSIYQKLMKDWKMISPDEVKSNIAGMLNRGMVYAPNGSNPDSVTHYLNMLYPGYGNAIYGDIKSKLKEIKPDDWYTAKKRTKNSILQEINSYNLSQIRNKNWDWKVYFKKYIPTYVMADLDPEVINLSEEEKKFMLNNGEVKNTMFGNQNPNPPMSLQQYPVNIVQNNQYLNEQFKKMTDAEP